MVRNYILGGLFLFLMMTGSGILRAQKVNPFAMAGLLKEPTVFEPYLISTELKGEYGITFSPDGTEALFTRRDFQHQPFMKIYYTKFKDGQWEEPRVVSFSGKYEDNDPMFTPDGKAVLFGSKRPVTAGEKEKKDFDIWMVERTSKGWGTPRHLGDAINTEQYDELYATMSRDRTIYFASNRPASFGLNDIYRAKFVNGAYQPAENVGASINTQHREANPFIAPDGSYLIFYSDRPGGYGMVDLYISHYKDGKWTRAVNLGEPVNSVTQEFSPFVSPNGKYLFFARGKVADIYQVSTAGIIR